MTGTRDTRTHLANRKDVTQSNNHSFKKALYTCTAMYSKHKWLSKPIQQYISSGSYYRYRASHIQTHVTPLNYCIEEIKPYNGILNIFGNR